MTARTFTAVPAAREGTPVMIGLVGPSGAGKTFSALRLATGIQTVTGGDIFGIDTEARRMLHYADRFKFKHVQFDAPFASLDYLAAIKHCATEGAKIIIIDSMSHEHEGPGGMLEFKEREYQRLGAKESISMLAWQKPKAARRDLLNGILQIPANFIFCFRAKEKIKIVRGTKTEIVPQGFMPIAGEEFVFEMTVNCLLLPHADGVPTWQSDEPGERMMMKLPEQFRTIFAPQVPLSEDIGSELAAWAAGGAPSISPEAAANETLGQWQSDARSAAHLGTAQLEVYWKSISKAARKAMAGMLDELKVTATEADAMREPEAVTEDVI